MGLTYKDMRTKSLILCAIAACVFVFLYSQSIRYPTDISISVKQASTRFLQIYYNTGRGWNDTDSSSARLSGDQEIVNLPLSLKQITHYRIDTAPGETSLIIGQLCFESILKNKCWGAEELEKKFVPFQDIVSHGLKDGGLEVITQGKDPYFAFAGDDRQSHDDVAKPSIPALILWSVILAMTIYIGLYLPGQWGVPFLVNTFRRTKAQGYAMSMGQAAMVFTTVSITISLSWIGLYELGAAVYLPIAALVASIVLFNSEPTFSLAVYLQSIASSLRHQYPGWREITIVSILILLPACYLLSSTWSQEFPNIGDHEYHWWANRFAYYFVRDEPSLLIYLLLGLVIAIALGKTSLYCMFTILYLLWDSSAREIHAAFYRYPAGGRFLTTPLFHLAANDWFSIFNVGRLTNFAGIGVWLLVLRPLVIGKWPSLSILPFALAFFYQVEVIYFFTSVYLEPWSLVLIALALELVLVTQGRHSYMKACLLVGMAAIIKEPAVFLIPWFWLAGQPWRKGKQHFYSAALIGAASILPFVIYYLVRKAFGISRFRYIGTDYFLSDTWLAEFGYRMEFHLGLAGIALMFVVAGLWLYLLIKQNERIDKFALTCTFGAAITVILMFNVDISGQSFTGYFRFYLPILLLLISPLLVVGLIVSNRDRSRKLLWIFSLIAVIGHGPKLYDYLSLTLQHDAARNFTEHYDAPVFLPIRSLITKAEQSNALKPGISDYIHVNHVSGWNQPDYGYKDLEEKYDLRMEGDVVCECSNDIKIVIAPFVHYTGLNQPLLESGGYDGFIPVHGNYIEKWESTLTIKDQCLVSLKKTCDFYAEEQIKGDAIGGIGIRY